MKWFQKRKKVLEICDNEFAQVMRTVTMHMEDCNEEADKIITLNVIAEILKKDLQYSYLNSGFSPKYDKLLENFLDYIPTMKDADMLEIYPHVTCTEKGIFNVHAHDKIGDYPDYRLGALYEVCRRRFLLEQSHKDTLT